MITSLAAFDLTVCFFKWLIVCQYGLELWHADDDTSARGGEGVTGCYRLRITISIWNTHVLIAALLSL